MGSRPDAATSDAPKLSRTVIARYAGPLRRGLWHLISNSARHKQLLLVMPVGAVALVTRPENDPARTAALRMVEDGAPRAAIGEVLGIPRWYWHLPPEAFRGEPIMPPADTPDEKAIGARILNLLPKAPSATGAWFSDVATARLLGGDEVALWLAARPEVRAGRRRPLPIRPFAVWAWYSQHPELAPGGHMTTIWRPEMGLARAAAEARTWLYGAIQEHCRCELPGQSIRAVREVDGIAFVPLTTPKDISDEARHMRNCLRRYIDAAMQGDCLLFGLRAGGTRVATLEVRADTEHRIAYLRQLCGPENTRPAPEIIAAAQRWLGCEGERLRRELRRDFGRESERLFAELIWRRWAEACARRGAPQPVPSIGELLQELACLSPYLK